MLEILRPMREQIPNEAAYAIMVEPTPIPAADALQPTGWQVPSTKSE